jgi:hypothetical protein
MRIVVATHSFHHVGGTETYVLTVAEQLQRLGHQTGIYSQNLGDMMLLARDRGVDVVGDPTELGFEPDVVLSQDTPMAYDLADRYPHVPQVFVNHSNTFDPQLPPLVPGIVSAVVVMSERFRARLEALDADLRIVRLRQPIDTERLVPRRSPAVFPRRVLLLGNYLAGDARRLLVDTWSELGLEVIQLGTLSRPTMQPEVEIADADIVVGKARALLDAMACGRPAYVYDAFGGDGWVTPENYDAIESDALAGQAFPDVIDADRLRKDFAAYDPMMGHVNRTLILKHHQARTHAYGLVSLIKEILPQGRVVRPVTESREMARQLRLRWRAEAELIGLRSTFHVASERYSAALSVAHVDAAEARREAEQLASRLHETEVTLAEERVRLAEVQRGRDRARARGRRLRARYATLLSHRWVRLGAALRLVRVPRRSKP